MINSDIRTKGGPVPFEIMATRPDNNTSHPLGMVRASGGERDDPSFNNRWFTTNNTPERMGDSVYIPVYSGRLDWFVDYTDNTNDNYLASRYNGMIEVHPSFNECTPNINSTGRFCILTAAPAHMVRCQ